MLAVAASNLRLDPRVTNLFFCSHWFDLDDSYHVGFGSRPSRVSRTRELDGIEGRMIYWNNAVCEQGRAILVDSMVYFSPVHIGYWRTLNLYNLRNMNSYVSVPC